MKIRNYYTKLAKAVRSYQNQPPRQQYNFTIFFTVKTVEN